MQRDWKAQLYNAKHLAFALCISLLLHLLLIGSFHLSLPRFGDESHFIEAQLVANAPPKVVKPAPPKPLVEEVKAEEKVVEPEPVQPEPVAEAPQVAPPDVPAPIEEIKPITEPPVIEPPEPIETPVQEPEAGLVNENAYKYVETEFDVRTDINAKVDSSAVGRAKIVYELLPSAEHYRIKSLMQAKGLAALVIPDLLQTSDGYLTDKGLRPMNYLYNFGDKKDKTYNAKFDWDNTKLMMSTSKGLKQATLVEGTQDLLSFMYQFMFIPPLQNMQLNITNGKKLGSYEYSFEGEEVIYSKMGDLRTIHLSRTGDDNDEKTELWLALDYQYVPVKIRKTEKEDKVYELLVTSLKASKLENPKELAQ